MKLTNRVAVITGSASGIGRASALEFAKEGAKVVVADINLSGARETAKQIELADGVAIPVEADVSAPDSVKDLVEKTIQSFGRVDVVFNNAAIQVNKTVRRRVLKSGAGKSESTSGESFCVRKTSCRTYASPRGAS